MYQYPESIGRLVGLYMSQIAAAGAGVMSCELFEVFG
jgi:hypothetical protein